jgi:predicted enzyme related to lactoylglutathione lyase
MPDAGVAYHDAAIACERGPMSEDWVRPVVQWGIRARNPQAIREFYGQMFNWPIGDGPIMRIPAGVGAPDAGPAGLIMQSDAPGVILFIQVLDLAASLEKAKALGGSVIAQPFDIPSGETIAQIADPEGTPIGLVQQ